MQQAWQQWLIPQDRQKLWPHVTIQNKVPPPVSTLLHQELAKEFNPFFITGLGFDLWEYQGGPWGWIKTFPLQNPDVPVS
jgi:hypothetical protein